MENKTIQLRCLYQTFDGKGVVDYNNHKYEFSNLLKDEEALFFVNKKDKYPLKLNKIVKISNKRIKSLCPVFEECGGCQFQQISYDEELKIKNDFIKDLFSKFKGFELEEVDQMFNPYNYRNKSQMTYKLSKSKKIVTGFYKENSHDLVYVPYCMIQSKKSNDVINKITEILNKHRIEVYDEKRRTGVLRHIVVRYGFNSKEVMVTFVTNGEMWPGRNNVVKDILKENLGITTIVQNFNSRNTSIVLQDKDRILYGNGYIVDTIAGYKFKISSKSFFQVNPIGLEKMYKKIIDNITFKSTDILLDTYCGVGTFGILLSKHVKSVIGVELNKDACKDAKQNILMNNINNIDIINSDSTKFMAEFDGKVDVLVMDPPRDGSTNEFIKNVARLAPRKVIYISCNPRTLERDLFEFSKYHYHLKKLSPIDVFARTSNLEVVSILELK